MPPTIPEVEAPFSIAATALPNRIVIKVLVAVIIVAVMAGLIHYTSPQRLTDVLVGAMAKLKETSRDAFDRSHLSASEMEQLKTLKRKVSAIQAETLSNSRSYCKALRGFFKGRTVTILLCVWEVRDLEKHIKIQSLSPEASTGAAEPNGAADNAKGAKEVCNGGRISWRGR
ncbi:hypothetical protein B0H19DRAFT_1228977 [Mycena capillaripes]|nr:hypothetical protein B0H19DRAFT_1228977 [Mycena capillaripes]